MSFPTAAEPPRNGDDGSSIATAKSYQIGCHVV